MTLRSLIILWYLTVTVLSQSQIVNIFKQLVISFLPAIRCVQSNHRQMFCFTFCFFHFHITIKFSNVSVLYSRLGLFVYHRSANGEMWNPCLKTRNCSRASEMEKAYKIAHTKLQVWKISTQKRANNAQNCAKFAKMPKICKIAKNLHKKGKTL